MNSKNLRGLCEAYGAIYENDDPGTRLLNALLRLEERGGEKPPTNRPPTPTPKPETRAGGATPKPETRAGGATPRPAAGPPSAPKPSGVVLARKNNVTGTLDKSTGKFTEKDWNDTETQRYQARAAQNAAAKPGTQAAGPASIKPKTPNPLLKDNKIGDMIAASRERQNPDGANITSDNIANIRQSGQDFANRMNAKQQLKTDFTRTNVTLPNYMKNSFSWGSASKLVDDIADVYSSIYEAKKKVDQDQDGDNDFADVRIARMIASGMSKEEAIAAVKNKEYNEEVEIDEATRMRKELGKQGEIATRQELATRSNEYRRSGSVDKTIAAAERAADRTTVRNRGENEGDYNKRMQKRSQTLSRLAANRRGSVRSGEGLRGYAAEVEGDDRNLQSARGSARSAGTLTPREKTMLNQEFELWVNELLYEGYDLSDYTWDEMYEAYLNEGVLGRDVNPRDLRPASERTGSALTSSQRASRARKAKKEQENQEKLEAQADNIIAQLTGSGRRPSRTSTSRAPAPEASTPSAVVRKLKPGQKKDTTAAKAAEVIRDLQSRELQVHKKGAEVLKQIQQNADFNLWIGELLDEGYTLENWTVEDLYDLYEEILEEKYSRA